LTVFVPFVHAIGSGGVPPKTHLQPLFNLSIPVLFGPDDARPGARYTPVISFAAFAQLIVPLATFTRYPCVEPDGSLALTGPHDLAAADALPIATANATMQHTTTTAVLTALRIFRSSP